MELLRYRIFIAHPKSLEAELDGCVAQLRQVLQTMNLGALELVTGRDDYAINFGRYGGWEGWTQSIASGSEYCQGVLVPRFNCIVVTPNRAIGRGTKAIVEQALFARKDVLFFDPGNSTYPITRVGRVAWNGGNWEDGWLLQ